MFKGKPLEDILRHRSYEEICEIIPIRLDGFVYGYLVYKNEQPYIVGNIIEPVDEYLSFSFWCPVQPETIGQYTGSRDKNNKEIYEGDLFYAPLKRLLKVTYDENMACFLGLLVSNEELGSPIHFMNRSEIEIIGNIHENPELLEGE